MKQLLFCALALFGATLNVSAALPPDFHNEPVDTVRTSLETFTAEGLGPRSISQYNAADGANTLAAGAFDAQSLGDVAQIGLPFAAFQTVISQMAIQGLAPRELSIVNMTATGITVYGGIWTHTTIPTNIQWYLTDAQFDAAWQEWVVQKGYRISDHQEWLEAGVRRHAAIFTQDGQPFVFYDGQSDVDFAAKNTSLGAQGFVLDKLNITTTPTGDIFSGIWLKSTQAMNFYYNMTADSYQQEFNDLGAQGFRLKQVLGYGPHGESMAAIWVK